MSFTKKKMGHLALATSLAMGIAMSSLTTANATPPSVVVYDSIGPSVPGNVASLAFQATQTSEFGDRVVLAGGSRYLRSVTVLMSSWGCESGNWTGGGGDCVTTPGATFNHDLTMSIYAPGVGLDVGATIVSSTQNFNIPFRPSADLDNCTDGRWYDGTTCFNGFATPVTFTFDGTVLLPDDVIWGISFNTSGYGANPLGYSTACAITPQGCGYDSLNVGVSGDLSPATGTDADSDGVYWDTDTAYWYCDGGTGGVGTFRSDTLPSCWSGYRPMASIETSAATVGPPTNSDQCKKDGWKTFNNPSFKNQGECVSYTNH